MDATHRFVSFGLAALLAVLLLVPTLVRADRGAIAGKVPAFAPDRILVKFKPGAAASDIDALTRQTGAASLRTIPGLDVHVLRVPAGTVADNIAVFERNPNVVYAEPDYYRVLFIPTEGADPGVTTNQYFEEQWALNNVGQLHTVPDPLLGAVQVQGTEDADIDAPEAWDKTKGNPDVKIAILDTGVDCRSQTRPGGSREFMTEPETDPYTGAVRRPKCIEETNFVFGYTSNYDGSPITVDDVVSHGTHVAGIAAAATNNEIGIAGVGHDSSIGSLKTCYEYFIDLYPPFEIWQIVGICPVSSSAAAITYAADNGYHVINMSYASDQVDENGDPLGLGGFSETENAAVEHAWTMGVVLVAAAGNGGNTVRSFPAAYDKVIAVGATDHNDNLASFSTFSRDSDDWVSILAPGENIISTVPNDLCVFYAELYGFVFDPDNDACLDWYSGTSMASPHVAGAAALVWGHLFSSALANPASCEDAAHVKCNQIVRQRLESGADAAGANNQNMRAWSIHGRLNVAGAIEDVSAPPPTPEPTPTPTVLSVVDNADGTATVTWDYGGQVELQREKLHAKRDVWQSLTTAWTGAGETAYTDGSGEGTFRYRVGAVLPDGSVLWSNWSDAVDVTGGGKGGGGKGGGGKGGGKPLKSQVP